MQDPNSVSLISLLKTLVKLRKVKFNGMGWASYSESLLKKYKHKVMSTPKSKNAKTSDARKFEYRFRTADTIEALLQVFTDTSNYANANSEKLLDERELRILMMSGGVPHVPEKELDYEGVLDIYEQFQQILEDLRAELDVSPTMKEDYEKAARAEFLQSRSSDFLCRQRGINSWTENDIRHCHVSGESSKQPQ